MQVSIDFIKPNPNQPRKIFDEDGLNSLSESIKLNGLIQPIVLEQVSTNEFWIIDGERRLRACKMLGESVIDAHIRESSSITMESRLVEAVVANIQREDLNPVEEAQAYKKLIDDHGYNVNQICQRIGKSYPTVSYRLELLGLEPEILDLIAAGKFSTDVKLIRRLKLIPDAESRVNLVKRCVERSFAVSGIHRAISMILRAEKIPENEKITQESMSFSEPVLDIPKKAVNNGREKLGIFEEAGKVPPWALFEKACLTACKKCPVRDMASKTVCGECPAVDVVKELFVLIEK